MARYAAKLRYYPGDPLQEIRQEALDRIGSRLSVQVSFARIDNRVPSGGMLREETLDRPFEEITQDVITVEANEEDPFREALSVIYEMYRSPRTPYSFSGSSPEGERIAKALADETGGGW
jgi:hypothetical protein